jgi:transposase-like protein
VADAFKTMRELDTINLEEYNLFKDTTETEKFCRMFNCLFDCFNTRSLFEAEHKRNEYLKPYTDKDDKRLKWLEHDFLQYLESWKVYAMGKEGLSMDKKSKLMLSSQTIEGLKMAVFSFVELIPHLLSLEGASFVLSERFNQDNVEVFFGKQRERSGRGDNPTADKFLYNTQAIRTSRSMSFGWSSNIRKRKLFDDNDIDQLSQPLRKRKRRK